MDRKNMVRSDACLESREWRAMQSPPRRGGCFIQTHPWGYSCRKKVSMCKACIQASDDRPGAEAHTRVAGESRTHQSNFTHFSFSLGLVLSESGGMSKGPGCVRQRAPVLRARRIKSCLIVKQTPIHNIIMGEPSRSPSQQCLSSLLRTQPGSPWWVLLLSLAFHSILPPRRYYN